MSATLQKVKSVNDDSGHWYVIPENLYPFFKIDLEDEDMVESGYFDNKWEKYRTGGDLNLVQLYAEL